MTKPSALLSGDPDDVRERLLEVARRERAPSAVRERALSRVAAVSLGVSVATTAQAASATPALGKAAGVLGVKWLAIGLGTALVGLTAVDQVQRVSSRAADQGEAPRAVMAPVVQGAQALPTARVAPVAVAPALIGAVPATPPIVAAPRAGTPPPAVAAFSAAPSAAAFEAPTVAQLAREVAALRQARAALASGKPGASLETLAAYHREFPLGVLGTEEAALRVEIAFAMGDANALESSRRFLAEHPTSPLAARVRALQDAKSASAIKRDRSRVLGQ